jgi:hypothetical protein
LEVAAGCSMLLGSDAIGMLGSCACGGGLEANSGAFGGGAGGGGGGRDGCIGGGCNEASTMATSLGAGALSPTPATSPTSSFVLGTRVAGSEANCASFAPSGTPPSAMVTKSPPVSWLSGFKHLCHATRRGVKPWRRDEDPSEGTHHPPVKAADFVRPKVVAHCYLPNVVLPSIAPSPLTD